MNESDYDAESKRLLDLDGEQYCCDSVKGYWVKFEISKIDPNVHIPYGIRYSLTLHDRYNTRLIGYDNAHAPEKKGRIKFGVKRETYDHKHIGKHVYEYNYSSPWKLLEDFWKDVEKYLKSGDM